MTGTRNFHPAPLVPMEKKFVVAHSCFCLSSLFLLRQTRPSVYFSYATPATSTMSNLLYILTSSTTTPLSYREVSTTHAPDFRVFP